MEKIKIALTDSGLGGLDVAAKLLERLKNELPATAIEIIFVNALPQIGRGYNHMPNTAGKVHMFNRVLWGIENHFHPQLTGIACNTLSAITGQTDYFSKHPTKIRNIIDIGIQAFLKNHRVFAQTQIVLYGTETTIGSFEYQKRFLKSGIAKTNLIPIMCPNLASEIELNSAGTNTRQLVEHCVINAVKQLKDHLKKIVLFLGCTHYGYVASFFREFFMNRGYMDINIFNPNDFLAESIFDFITKQTSRKYFKGNGLKTISVFSRCKILPGEVKSVTKLLAPVSAQTAEALQKYQIKENLF